MESIICNWYGNILSGYVGGEKKESVFERCLQLDDYNGIKYITCNLTLSVNYINHGSMFWH